MARRYTQSRARGSRFGARRTGGAPRRTGRRTGSRSGGGAKQHTVRIVVQQTPSAAAPVIPGELAGKRDGFTRKPVF